jgi:hypothetical protein
MGFSRVHLFKRRSNASHRGWSAGDNWGGKSIIAGFLSSFLLRFVAFCKAGEPMRGRGVWLAVELAVNKYHNKDEVL